MKKKKNNIFGKILVISLICFFASVFYNKYSEIKEYRHEINSLQSQIDEQREHGKELDKIAKEYSTDKYIEKYARMLGLVKPNEKIFRNYNDKR